MTFKIKIEEVNNALKTITLIDNSNIKVCGLWSPVILDKNNYYKLSFIDENLLYSFGRMENGHFVEKTKNGGFLIGKTEQGVLKNFIEVNNEGETEALDYTYEESPKSILGIIFKNMTILS